MTEDEWATGTDPVPLLEQVRRKASQRKLRLFAVACCRQVWHLLRPEHRDAVAVAERFADRQATLAELRAVHSFSHQPERFTHASEEAYTASFAGYQVAIGAAYDAANIAADSARRALPPGGAAGAEQADLLRELFGNPFRRVRANKRWFTDTAVALARGMYESRDFGAMPILADALQDAGCEDEQVLNHCRAPGPHVRGCWVVDLVLGQG